MTHNKPDDATEFARQDIERGVLNEIVTEEQRQRQELEDLLARMKDYPYTDALVESFVAQLAAILQR